MLHEVIYGELRRHAQSKRHRRGDASPPLFHIIAVDNLIHVPHEVHPQRGRLAEALVDVARAPGEKSIPKAERPAIKTL